MKVNKACGLDNISCKFVKASLWWLNHFVISVIQLLPLAFFHMVGKMLKSSVRNDSHGIFLRFSLNLLASKCFMDLQVTYAD